MEITVWACIIFFYKNQNFLTIWRAHSQYSFLSPLSINIISFQISHNDTCNREQGYQKEEKHGEKEAKVQFQKHSHGASI
jgi:hypothetical protein